MRAAQFGVGLALFLALAPARAADTGGEATLAGPAGMRSGLEIYERFREGLADPECPADASARWQAHFAHAPAQMASRNSDVLPLFGYVVDAVRAAHLPSEFALIPFVESGYKPGARSPQGPVGLWQMIAVTARNHKVPIRAGYDGRLSPVESTRAAVRYLKTLHGMFAGDWRLAVMAYNAGEYRVLGALRRGGQVARDARPEALPGLSPITHAYVRKLHALSCLLGQAREREAWLQALDRPVPLLAAVVVPDSTTDLAGWARGHGQDPARLLRLNPAFPGGRLVHAKGEPLRVLAEARGSAPGSATRATGAVDLPPDTAASSPLVALAGETRPAVRAPDTTTVHSPPDTQHRRRHTVARGESAWKIAARYGIRVSELLERNGLSSASVLRPGKVLQIDMDAASAQAR